MTRYFIAVTYVVCEHNNLYEAMNVYHLDLSIDQISKLENLQKWMLPP